MYDNTNRGTLGKNDRKQQDTHADYNGTINIEGKDFWLNAWLKDGKNGKFFSLSVKPKEAYVPADDCLADTKTGYDDLVDDSIPF